MSELSYLVQGESTRDATIAQGLDPCAVAGN